MAANRPTSTRSTRPTSNRPTSTRPPSAKAASSRTTEQTGAPKIPPPEEESKPKFHKWIEPASDEDEPLGQRFSVEAAWNEIFRLPTCTKVMLNGTLQRRLELVVGLHVTQEFPWKQIRLGLMRDYLFDELLEDGKYLSAAFQSYSNDIHVLIGFCPLLAEENEEEPIEKPAKDETEDKPDEAVEQQEPTDPFIFFTNPNSAKKALTIIRSIEAYERWMLQKRIIKKPRRWVSLGSENEVNLTLQKRQAEPVETEIQSVYPMTIPGKKEFELRLTADVRDGYIELLPGESERFDVVVMRRVTVGIQSAPAMVTLEQQTDPTFPTNAWSQYLYEIKEGDDALDESSDDEAAKDKDKDKEKDKEKRGSKPASPDATEVPPEKKPPPELSDQIKFLLSKLEFNQIDNYRDDYSLISDHQICHYTTPYLEETLCFANISKSQSRYVCGIDWYPSLSGLIVTSYTFSTPATIEALTTNEDFVQRAVLEPNPTLMWSFSDNLDYKLEFESPLEVTALSFCPHYHNLLFGGLQSGQLIIWDLQSRVDRLDTDEVLTAAQTKYRTLISDFLKDTIVINEEAIVPPATISQYELSPKAAITGFYWLGQRYFVNNFGKVYTDPDPNKSYKFFMTCAVDGTVTFWDLDAAQEKKVQGMARRDQPKALTSEESPFKSKIIKPIFSVVFNEPITAVVADTSVFSCIILDKQKKKIKPNFKITLEKHDAEEMRQSLITSSFYGRIERLNWMGLYSEADGRESVTSALSFARVHDGPVISMKKNPFYPSLFASIGRNVFAVWREDYNYSPIFWRKRSSGLTSLAWSEDRPAVLFLTRIDGNLEAWDLLARDDDACLDDILGGGVVTAISEHRPREPEKLLGIGDYNSSFRMVRLPPSFYQPVENELEIFKEYIERELARKKHIQAWELDYNERNKDVIEARHRAEAELRAELERLEKEAAKQQVRLSLTEDKAGTDNKATLSYPERMKRQWDELNLNRLMSILMSRKRVDAEELERLTATEKKRLAYEAAKKESFLQTLRRSAEEVAAVRARILPAEKVDMARQDMINSIVDQVMEAVPDYAQVKTEANHIIRSFDEFDEVDYIEFLHRGEKRRQILNKSLGGNTERLYWYEEIKKQNLLEECDWGYESFLIACGELQTSQESAHPSTDDDFAVEYSESIRPSEM